jgi:plastocyanin
MAHKWLVALGGALLSVMAVSWGPGAMASGGGACPAPITNGDTTEAEIENYCFSPTIVHARAGATVTWVNRDAAPHTITGANRAWGSYDKLKVGESTSYQFKETGVYPYYCVFHLGMVGAVVVGNNQQSSLPTERRSDKSAVTHVEEPALQAASAGSLPIPRSNEPSKWLVLGLVAMILVVPAVGIVASRRSS